MPIPRRRRARATASPGQEAPPDAGPSFVALLRSRHRVLEHVRDGPETSPLAANAIGKIGTADAVARAGVRVPERLGTWPTPGDIPWDDLPDRVVVKSDHGSSSHGVLPIVRTGRGWRYVTRREVHHAGALADRLSTQEGLGRLRGPYFAEQLVAGPGPDALPDDVKVYTFHDRGHLVMVRRVHAHLRKGALSFRVVDRHGEEHPYHGLPSDRSIPLPDGLDRFLHEAGVVGAMCRAPFTRVDFYDSPDGPVFGEVTAVPGGPQWFGAAADRAMGEEWERGEGRLWRETADGASLVPWR